MLLIADSGSTKTNWSLINEESVVKEINTIGINPFYQDEQSIETELQQKLMPVVKNYKVTSVIFYGAGCSFPEKKAIVANVLGKCFPNAVIEVQSDLLGAARALFARSEGIACILGTGSNSCYYDGNKIVENVSPLGFILGDEGSGAVLSKTLVADCLKNQLPNELSKQFMDQYFLTPAIILEQVYKKPFPNRYLAQFTPFLSMNLNNSAIYNIVYSGFTSFFTRNIVQYPKNNKIGFIGSVAFHLSDVLVKVATEQQYTISEIVKSPMEGLIKYHTQHTL